MKLLQLASVALSLVAFNANAIVVNTLNGTDYEWLELTETQGLSRNQVELMLNDSSSALYGYEYASRDLVEDLFHSYALWTGFGGVYEAPEVVSGIYSLQNDFGMTASFMSKDIGSVTTVEGNTIWYDGYDFTGGFYGLEGECGLTSETCMSALTTYLDDDGNLLASLQHYRQGWDSSIHNPFIDTADTVVGSYGSYLVKELSPVPVPSSLWLLASGLMGLIGFAKRKARA